MNQVNAQIAPSAKVDPARGKPSSFFVVMPVNPEIPADPYFNPLKLTMEQQAFVVQYYPAYIYSPVNIICWLFTITQERDFKEAEDLYYKTQINKSNDVPSHDDSLEDTDEYVIEEVRGN